VYRVVPRLFVPIPLQAGTHVTLPADTAHHVREVLRLKSGDSVSVFDGTGGEYAGEVSLCTRERVEVRLATHLAPQRESSLAITLAQGLARGERMDYTLQKAVELGVTRIVPLATERSQVKLDATRAARRRDHWLGIIHHACEQSGRTRVPELAPIETLATFIAKDHAEVRLSLAPTSSMSLATLPADARSFSVVIGPEGGLSPTELDLLASQGYRGVRLGPRILRTETAALVALTALQILRGDLARD
jgi:16S rRNA (uracil1498-N3)-methyltransferase